MEKFIKHFIEIDLTNLPEVGGKNASLGEMFQKLTSQGVQVPDGFAITSAAYWYFLEVGHFREEIFRHLRELDKKEFSNLSRVGSSIRTIIVEAEFPSAINDVIKEGYQYLVKKYGPDISLAVRSSATAEDLPSASFAGQQEVS